MFRIQKIRGFFSIASFFLATVLFSSVSFADSKPADVDGDFIPDGVDPAPLLANLPFHWSVQAISFQFFWDEGQTNGFRMFLREDRSPVRLARPSMMTAAPVLQGDHAGSGSSPALGLFGDGCVAWGKLERNNASLALESMEALPPDVPVDFGFIVHFTNLDATHWRFAKFSIPIELDGRAWATAAPVDTQARERGFLIPADGKTYIVPFFATMPASTARKFLKELSESDRSPDFALIHAKGVEMSASSGRVFALDEKFESILKKTAPVHVEGPAGQSWHWRIALKRPDGERTTIADWADAVNFAARTSRTTGLPSVAFSKDGYLLSLVGWDTGTWDDWWQVSVRGKNLKKLDWRSQDCKHGVRFSLRHQPPVFSKADRECCMNEFIVSPVYSMLLGVNFWNEGKKEDSYHYLRKAASAGLPQAYSWLGFILALNETLPSNSFYSASSYRQAADLKYAPGEAWYGNCLLRGKGVKANAQSALAYLKRSAEQKYPEGQALYGLCLLRGVGTKADPETARKILLDASLRGDSTAQFGLGVYLLEKHDPDAIAWIRLAAADGNQRAQLRFAELLRDGAPGIPPNPARAIEWYEAAAKQGSTSALMALGEAFQSGNGVRKDDRKAAGYFYRAAEKGDRQGQTWFGLCLLDGVGVSQNPTEAVKWLEKAAKQGFPDAQYILGMCLHGGFGGIHQDKEAAIRWFKAASLSLEQARIFLGYCYFMGDGVPQDKKQAVRIFEEAAKSGSVAGQLWLSYCFANGEGVTIDFTQARKWARAAAEQGNSTGKELLQTLPRD